MKATTPIERIRRKHYHALPFGPRMGYYILPYVVEQEPKRALCFRTRSKYPIIAPAANTGTGVLRFQPD